MSFDLKGDLLEEIALEGLDGITIQALFLRLTERRGFQLKIDDNSKVYVWKCVLNLKPIQYYLLEKPRPELLYYNRFDFVDPVTFHYTETDAIPEDIYKNHIVEKEGVYGSCVDFDTRKNITETIQADKPSVQDAIEKYGSRLVMVADQDVRVRTLIGSQNDPMISINKQAYCVLERIGRSRYSGETSMGVRSFRIMDLPPKTVYYYIKQLRHLDVMDKQNLCLVKKPTIKASCKLYHLKRFTQRVKNRQLTELYALASLLAEQPEQMMVLTKLKEQLAVESQKSFKKTSQLTINGERIFNYLDVPYRELYPDATARQYMIKSGKTERHIRHLKMYKSLEEVKQGIDDEFDAEEDDDEEMETGGALPIEPLVRSYDKPYIKEVLDMFNRAGPRGLTQNQLGKAAKLTRLSARRYIKYLTNAKLLKTVVQEQGRQKTIVYVTKESIKDNVLKHKLLTEMEKLGLTEEYIPKENKKSNERYKKKKKDAPKPTTTATQPNIDDDNDDDDDQMSQKESTEEHLQENKTQDDIPETTEMKESQHEDSTQEGVQDDTMDLTCTEEDFTKQTSATEDEVTQESSGGKSAKKSSNKKLTQKSPEKTQIPEISDAPISKDTITKIAEELDRLEEVNAFRKHVDISELSKETQAKKKLMREYISENENLVHVKIEERYRYTKDTPGPALQGLKRFGVKLSESHVRRVNWIVEVTSAIRVVEAFRILKLLRNREKDMNMSINMDTKSLKRLYIALTEEGKIRCYHVKISIGEKSRELTYLCAPQVEVNDEYFLRQIEEAKLRYFSLSREEVRKRERIRKETLAITPPSSRKEDKEVPTSALESIRRNKELVKQFKQKPSQMKYNRRAGRKYGLLPKMLRIQAVHQYLFHLCHDTYGNKIMLQSGMFATSQAVKVQDSEITTLNAEDEVMQTELVIEAGGEWPAEDPPVYYDEWTWRRYLSPVPAHSGYKKGWCLISDVLLRLPVYLFCQIVNVCYDIEGLQEILDDSNKRLYPVVSLPWRVSHKLLYSKKYVTSFMETCGYLCEMGLLSFGKEIMKEVEQTFVYLHQHASLMDTRASLKGYNKTREPEDVVFSTKQFHLEKLSDLHDYWENLQIIALSSNLSYKSKVHEDIEDKKTFEERALKIAVKPYSPDTIIDDGVIPGDRRGAAGIDSALFVNVLKNWTFTSLSKQALRDKNYKKHWIPKGLSLQGGRKIVDMYNKGLGLKGQSRLCLSDDPEKPLQIKKVVKEHTKGNKGGKGIKRLFVNTKRIIRREDGRIRLKRTVKYSEHKPAPPRLRKKPSEKGDDKDKNIYKAKTKQRVLWTDREDSVLLMCRLSVLIMDGGRKTSLINKIRIRDYLHRECGEVSYDKSSEACNRRIRFALRNKNTENNLLLYYREALQDEHVVQNFVSNQYIITDPTVEIKFHQLTDYLLKKFQTLNVQKCSLPETMAELKDCTVEPIEKLMQVKDYRDVTNREDICKDVLRNILHSAVLLSDKQGRTHEMFKLLSQYPDVLLSNVIKELRADGLYVIHKKHYQRESINQLQSGMGLRNFKVSQRYMYNYKHKYLSTLFQESAVFLEQLHQNYAQAEQGITLDFHPKGGQSAILIPLVLLKMINFKIKMPEELVVIDMTGFYNFPWGRGKTAATGSMNTKSDKRLQELFSQKMLQQEMELAKNKAEEFTDVDDFAEEITMGKDQKSSEVTEDKDKTVPDESVTVENSNGEPKKDSGIVGVGVESVNQTMEITDDSVSEFDKTKETGDKAVDKDRESGEDMDIENDDSDKDEDDNSRASSSTKCKIQGTKENCGVRNVTNTGTSSSEVTHDIHKHGSSTIIAPMIKEKPVEDKHYPVSAIASRTLLSLKRAEDPSHYTFDDIRVFNAQDNFVVKSCKVEIQLRDKIEESRQATNTDNIDKIGAAASESKLSTDSASHTDDALKGADEKEKVIEGELRTEKLSEAERLKVPKQKRLNLWTEMQRILPFKLEMCEVWKSLLEYNKVSVEELEFCKQIYHLIEGHGELGIKMFDMQLEMCEVWKSMLEYNKVSGEELEFCKQIYHLIEGHGELGIKMFDMQKKFSDSCKWKSAVKLLMHYAAKIQGTLFGKLLLAIKRMLIKEEFV